MSCRSIPSPLAARLAPLLLLSCTLPLAAAPLPRFSGNAVWNQNISSATVHPGSAGMISTLTGLGGFGNGRLQIDFTIHVVHAAAGAPTRTIASHPGGYYSPDCEPLGTAMPVPAGAAIEGETGLVCDNLDNDCHLLVVQGRTLYEAYGVTAQGGGQLQAWCLAIWHLDITYPATGRGDHCTSADAAGFPMAPLLWNADDIAASAGDRRRPAAATSATPSASSCPTAGWPTIPPWAAKAAASTCGRPPTPAAPAARSAACPTAPGCACAPNFPLTNYPPAARVVLNTLKRYGMVLSDGGSVALTGESDLYTTAKWADLDINEQVFYRNSRRHRRRHHRFRGARHRPADRRNLGVRAQQPRPPGLRQRLRKRQHHRLVADLCPDRRAAVLCRLRKDCGSRFERSSLARRERVPAQERSCRRGARRAAA